MQARSCYDNAAAAADDDDDDDDDDYNDDSNLYRHIFIAMTVRFHRNDDDVSLFSFAA